MHYFRSLRSKSVLYRTQTTTDNESAGSIKMWERPNPRYFYRRRVKHVYKTNFQYCLLKECENKYSHHSKLDLWPLMMSSPSLCRLFFLVMILVKIWLLFRIVTNLNAEIMLICVLLPSFHRTYYSFLFCLFIRCKGRQCSFL